MTAVVFELLSALVEGKQAADYMRRAGLSEKVIMQLGGWKTRGVFDRYNIIDRRDIGNAIRQLKAHEKSVAESRNGYNPGYSAPDSVQNTPPDKIQ